MGISKNKQWKHTNVALLKGELEGMTLDNNSQDVVPEIKLQQSSLQQNISPPLYSTSEKSIAKAYSTAKTYSTTNIVGQTRGGTIKSPQKQPRRQRVQFIDTSKLLTS